MTENVAQRIKKFNALFLQHKIQLKYHLMAESPYRFFRGTCHLFYEDLSKQPPMPPSPLVWMCGDLHVENLGSFKGDNKLVYFDLNDFDEAVLGPVAWELVRMTTSIFVAFEDLEIEGKKAMKWAKLFLETYSKVLTEGKAKAIEVRTAHGIVKRFLDAACKRKEKDLLRKYTKKKKKKLGFLIDEKKLYGIDKKLNQELRLHIEDWLNNRDDSPYNYDVLDACFRVAGTGSLGVKRYLFLLRSTKNKSYLLLDMKEATPSSLMPYLNIKQPKWESEAERTVSIQKRVQNVVSALLTTSKFKESSYVMQEMQPVEDKVDFSLIKNNYREVCEVINEMAVLTASAHLRSSGRQGSSIADDLIKFGDNKDWLDALLNYSVDYSKKVKIDYEEFLKNYKEGFFKK